jgi:nicotinamidase/pyrazinamidase
MDLILRKGMDPRVDSYSGFRENWDARGIRRPTGLAGYLREREVKNVYICGLARDVCCKWTVEDAASSGFQSHILWDLTRPVVPGSNDRNREEMLEGGVGVVEFFREQTVKR